ncbi:uncharacterized protein [Leptinotarsa decemlineata]|uniref:uncharacterized protein n=1 Tax=Leptinotarsa decemlineata TaxID=7539 RepID=UPI003D30C256
MLSFTRLESTIQKIKEKKVSLEESIAKLTEAIKTQPCSYKEKMELLKRIKALEDKRDIVKGKIEHAQKIKSDFDAKLNAEQATLQNLVIDWNRSLMEVSIKKPELKKLMLKETGFHKPSYLDEIKKVAQLKIEFEAEMARKMVDIENELKDKTARKKAIENEVETLEKMISEIDEQMQRHGKKKVEMEMDFARVKAEYEKEREELTQELRNPQKEEELKILSEKESLLRNEMESMDKLVKTEQKKIVCFFVDLHKQVRHNISEMDNILKNVEQKFEQRALQALENGSRIIDTMKTLKGSESSGE